MKIRQGEAFSVVHAADLHLGSAMRVARKLQLGTDLRETTYDALDRLVSLCQDRPSNVLTLGGDLFDLADQLNPTPRRKLRDALATIPRTPVAIVRGNHDYLNPKAPRVDYPPNVTEFNDDCKTLDLGWVRVHGVSYNANRVLNSLLPLFPKASRDHFDIGLLHANVGNHAEHLPYAPCSAKELIDLGYKMWLLGHIHKREVLNENPLVLYPGNIQGRDAGEIGPRTAEVIEVSGAGAVHHRPVSVHSVLWAAKDVDVSACHTIDDVLDLVRKRAGGWAAEVGQEKGLILRIRLTGQTEAHEALVKTPEAGEQAAAVLLRDEIVERYGEASPFILVDKVSIDTTFPIDLERLKDSESVLGVLVRLSQDPSVMARASEVVAAEGLLTLDQAKAPIAGMWPAALQGALGRIRGRLPR